MCISLCPNWNGIDPLQSKPDSWHLAHACARAIIISACGATHEMLDGSAGQCAPHHLEATNQKHWFFVRCDDDDRDDYSVLGACVLYARVYVRVVCVCVCRWCRRCRFH